MYRITFTLFLIAAMQVAASAAQRPQQKAGGTSSQTIKRDTTARTVRTTVAPTAKSESKARKPTPVVNTQDGPASRTQATPRGGTKSASGLRSRSREVVTFQSGESLRVIKVTGRLAREHRDPNNSGNPLLDTSGENRTKKLSKNFTVGEFAHSGETLFYIARIDPDHVDCLQGLRNYVGKAVRIDSGYRSSDYNKKLYERRHEKVTSSQHISGRATDVKIEGMSGKEIAEAAIDACGPDIAVGLGPRYAHIDGRGQFGIWKYKGVSDRQVAEVKFYRTSKMVAQKARARRLRSRRV